MGGRKVRTIGVALIALLSMSAENANAGGARTAGIEGVISHLRIALRGRGTAVRLYYRANSCEDLLLQFDPLSVEVRAPRTPGSPLSSVRDMFAGDPRVVVAESPEGIVRITVDEPPASLLQTRIGSFKLGESDRYSALLAIVALENHPDMQEGASQANMEIALNYISILFRGANPSLPHLPAEFRDVTADRILDSIATTFDGIVTYAVCPDSKNIRIRFVDLDTP